MLLIVFGILTYYVAPSALIYNNLALFIGLMNTILAFMIIGLTFLMQLL